MALSNSVDVVTSTIATWKFSGWLENADNASVSLQNVKTEINIRGRLSTNVDTHNLQSLNKQNIITFLGIYK